MNPNSIDELEQEYRDKSEANEATLIHEIITGELETGFKRLDF